MPIPSWMILEGIKGAERLFGSSKEGEKKPEEKKPAEEKPKQEPKKDKEYKKGGYVRAADGCAKRGKTKGRMV